MPKRSKKSKSKRLSLKQKYKVIKKVREHHKKKRREERKAAAAGKKPKAPKDPGIPSQWPFKEELLKEMAWKRQQILLAEKAKKEERKRAREERIAMEAEAGDGAGLAALSADAAHKAQDFEARKRARLLAEDGAAAGGTKGGDTDNSRRAFYREFRRVVEMSDVVIQVLDARDPAGCRCIDVERYVRSLDPAKRIVLLLNKMDLVPREVGEAWLKHYRRELPTVAFKASTQHQAEGLSAVSAGRRGKTGTKAGAGGKAGAGAGAAAAAGAGCLGADTLLQLLKNYARHAGGGKASITVGVVGLPNVGKSSLINSLKRARVAQVGSTPGVTKGLQEIHLDKHIRLLDSPGIVFSSGEGAAAAALRNAVKVERLTDPVAPVTEILARVPAKQLMRVYRVADYGGSVQTFLQYVAEARGKLKRGGVLDVEAAARVVLQDWNSGVIPYYTLPPAEDANAAYEDAAVVSGWAQEFDADRVFAAEESAVIQHLQPLDAADFIEASSAGQVALQLDEMEAEEQQQQQGAAADAMDEGDGALSGGADGAAAVAAAARATRAALGQNAELYGELGQHNPRRARAEARRARRTRADFASAAAAGLADDDDDDGGSDFDFDAANEAAGITQRAAADGNDSSGSPSDDGSSGNEVSDDDSQGEGEEDSGSGDYGADADAPDADRAYEEAMES